MRPQGRLQLTIRSTEGALVAERRASNRVLRSGAKILAGLFTGTRVPAGGIDKVRFGFGNAPLQLEDTELRPRFVITDVPNLLPIVEHGPEASLAPGDFTIETGQDAVMVNISLSFTPPADVGDVSEAALFAGNDLYNHVLFEPVDMKSGQTITFFWEITFPFGN